MNNEQYLRWTARKDTRERAFAAAMKKTGRTAPPADPAGGRGRRVKQTPLERLKSMIPVRGNARDELLEELLGQAEEFILTYTNRAELTENMHAGLVRLALLYYNRMGIEGEGAHAEGGVSRSVDALPIDLLAWLNAKRLQKQGAETEAGGP